MYYIILGSSNNSIDLEKECESNQSGSVTYRKYVRLFNKYTRVKKKKMALEKNVEFFKKHYIRKSTFIIILN